MRKKKRGHAVRRWREFQREAKSIRGTGCGRSSRRSAVQIKYSSQERERETEKDENRSVLKGVRRRRRKLGCIRALGVPNDGA